MYEMEIMFRSSYRNVDPRRRQELTDSNMVHEDKQGMANCSNTPVYKEFNPNKFTERLSMYNQSNKKYPS